MLQMHSAPRRPREQRTLRHLCCPSRIRVHNTIQSAHKLMRSNAAESMKQRNSLVLLSCAAVRQHGMCAGASQGHACDESECGRLAAHRRREGHVMCCVDERRRRGGTLTGRSGLVCEGRDQRPCLPSGACPGNRTQCAHQGPCLVELGPARVVQLPRGWREQSETRGHAGAGRFSVGKWC